MFVHIYVYIPKGFKENILNQYVSGDSKAWFNARVLRSRGVILVGSNPTLRIPNNTHSLVVK